MGILSLDGPHSGYLLLGLALLRRRGIRAVAVCCLSSAAFVRGARCPLRLCAKVSDCPMFSSPSLRFPAIFASWLPPAVERLNSPAHASAWPAPELAPLDLPTPLREHLLRGLLAACKQRLQRQHALSTDAASANALLCSSEESAAWFSAPGLERSSTLWLIWLEEIEARLALRVLLAPVSAFGVVQTWKGALARQTALATRFVRLARLHQALSRRLGSEEALAALDRALAALAEEAGD